MSVAVPSEWLALDGKQRRLYSVQTMCDLFLLTRDELLLGSPVREAPLSPDSKRTLGMVVDRLLAATLPRPLASRIEGREYYWDADEVDAFLAQRLKDNAKASAAGFIDDVNRAAKEDPLNDQFR